MTDAPQLDYGRETVSRRRRWLRRAWRWLWRATAVIGVVLVIAHTVWLVRATSAMNREVAALVAVGEPTSPAALQPVVPTGDNAFTLFEPAGKVLQPASVAYRRLDMLVPKPPLFALERQRMQAYVDERSAAVPWIEQALAAPANVSTVRLSSPLINVRQPELNEHRAIATFQKYQAMLAHERPDDAEALRLTAGMEVTAVSASSTPTLVGMLVATGIRSTQTQLLLDFAPVLRIGTAVGDAPPARVRQTIADLLDTRVTDAERVTAFRGERVYVLDTLRCMDDGSLQSAAMPAVVSTKSAVLRYLHRPLVRSNAATSLRIGNARIAALSAPDWPTAQARLAAGRTSASSYAYPLNVYIHILVGSLDRAVHVGYVIRTDRRLAAVALAVRLHEYETGRRPASWADLVPRYLPSVPLDPLAAARPLQARFTGSDPILWSVGENGVDEFASERTLKTSPSGPWDGFDRVLHLVPPPRVAEGDLKRLIDLDLDGPLGVSTTSSPTTAPQAATAPTDVSPTPDWDSVDRLTVTRVAGQVAGLTTRRDLFRVLAGSIDLPPDPAAATAPSASVEGVIGSPDGTWRFTLRGDRTVVFVAPDGVESTRSWDPAGAAMNDDFWQ